MERPAVLLPHSLSKLADVVRADEEGEEGKGNDAGFEVGHAPLLRRVPGIEHHCSRPMAAAAVKTIPTPSSTRHAVARGRVCGTRCGFGSAGTARVRSPP